MLLVNFKKLELSVCQIKELVYVLFKKGYLSIVDFKKSHLLLVTFRNWVCSLSLRVMWIVDDKK